MPDSSQVYTYRAGRKVPLTKKGDEFVVRALPEELRARGFTAEKVSSASSRVTTRSGELEPQMERARRLAPTHHSYYVADTGQEFLITDRVYVKFRQPPAPADLDAFAGRYGLVLRDTYSDREFLFQVTEHTGINPVKLVVRLNESEPAVEMADHDLNQRMATYQFALPTDPSYVQQWHLHRHSTDPDFDARSSSLCEDAWQVLGGYGSGDVVVGVTDDGCKLDHPDFDSPDKFAGWAYLQGTRLVRSGDVDADRARMYQPGSNHGTSCAGVIAGEVDALLTVGAAPGCRLLPVKWESSGPSLFISDSKMRTVLDFIANKVDVLSNSWGGVPTNTWSPFVTNRIAELAQSGGRRGRGIVFLWAAGNDDCPIQHTATVDVPYTSGWQAGPSGDPVWVGPQTARRFENNLVGIPGVMHVAALASTAQRSHYSNYGTGIGICAPTSNGHRFFRMTVRGLRITTTTGETGGVTSGFGGTSSATPLVAGIAALAVSANPEMSAPEVISLLKRTASKDLNQTGYSRTAPAVFDPNPTWDISPVAPFDSAAFTDIGSPDGTWSPWFGHGKVDARAAVAAALRSQPDVTRTVRHASSPQIPIPDNAPAGVRDTIAVPETGTVREVRVTVDITHTWIGDLRVELEAPGGARVILHDRSGSSADNIRQTYDVTNLAALAALRGGDMAGNWALVVQDTAAQDVGVLNQWALEIEAASAAAPEQIVAGEAVPVRIPDADPGGITRTLEVAGGGMIREIAVSVDITHPWIGDLRVTLAPPGGGDPIVLHNLAGGAADNLIRTWRSQDLPALAALRGREPAGRWELRVADTVRQDEGKLNSWKLEFEVQAAVLTAAGLGG